MQDLTSGSIVNKWRRREGESDINNPVSRPTKLCQANAEPGAERGSSITHANTGACTLQHNRKIHCLWRHVPEHRTSEHWFRVTRLLSWAFRLSSSSPRNSHVDILSTKTDDLAPDATLLLIARFLKGLQSPPRHHQPITLGC
ncbi:hypothetical protein KOW79_018004 [Hemibagrus wyckioides]|uniref:Uncharacterized protein n=1 Tax=Hemibagrus wyckioides TaxID=337641 RepID=A0A9D3N995_9TELE|nr:hypothetical protein KOW79_018004 [Hemibagrus wyckioides]